MAQFVVLEPAGAARMESAEQAVFVRDGFSVLALILPVVWLLGHRLWFEAIAVLGVTILLGFAGSLLGIADTVPLLSLLVSLFVALEGSHWKIARLRRKGYRERAAIEANNLDEAEIRYFSALDAGAKTLEQKPAPEWSCPMAQPSHIPPAHNPTGSTIGFVGYRGEN
ncbi:DUF2628 domain-containing protein [Falsochrobactrum shanghaiense]|uniref:DUF2628 domain-containing protein n=1 Tax=Falsochrobactrum shanghaiense TaxID=2201899 RepID=A0A316JDG5_9HYPH|nr:DUF2628 domain-containing protein [Falsochrobactrum shanghaiense]PWL19544.1 DUF2628 domain-containing protein [Falsochrobactrum shanghaiense]